MWRWISVSVLLAVLPCVSFVRGFVPAPSNVSFQCKNFKNILYWNSTELNLQTEFVVKVRGYESNSVQLVRTNQTYLDVSEYSRNVEDTYFVSVTTELNGSQSEFTEIIDFTYNEDFTTTIKCEMDFPAVNVTISEHKVIFSFYNPFSVYEVDGLQDFRYSVTYNTTKSDHDCEQDEELCTKEINFHESLFGQCISLHFNSIGISSELTEVICGKNKASQIDLAIILTILACTGFFIGIVILGVAAIFKNETTPGNNSAILSKLLAFGKADRVVHEPEKPVMSEVTSIGSTPLLENTLDFPPQSSDTFNEITHMPLHHSTTSIEACGEQESEEEDTWEKNNYSGYDCKKILVDMGSRDFVDAYGPR